MLLFAYQPILVSAFLGTLLVNVGLISHVDRFVTIDDPEGLTFDVPTKADPTPILVNATHQSTAHRHPVREWAPPDLPKDDGGHCRCVHCDVDELCGGLWKANRFVSSPVDSDGVPAKKQIHIVVSHCKRDLHWLSNFTEGFDISSIYVISKCGVPVNGAPDLATIEELPNVGRCDHSYAFYIDNVLDGMIVPGEETNSIVFFLKDDISDENLHQPGKWATFDSMVRIASSVNGFACGVDAETAGYIIGPRKRLSYSAYHDTEVLSQFKMRQYDRKQDRGYEHDGVGFTSRYNNLRAFYETITNQEIHNLPELTQVCYGGAFAASYSNIKRVDAAVWRRASLALSRGDSIEEGHHMERCWGLLLASPLHKFQVEALRHFTDTKYTQHSWPGMLFKHFASARRTSDETGPTPTAKPTPEPTTEWPTWLPTVETESPSQAMNNERRSLTWVSY